MFHVKIMTLIKELPQDAQKDILAAIVKALTKDVQKNNRNGSYSGVVMVRRELAAEVVALVKELPQDAQKDILTARNAEVSLGYYGPTVGVERIKTGWASADRPAHWVAARMSQANKLDIA